jgi:hypothetical protein
MLATAFALQEGTHSAPWKIKFTKKAALFQELEILRKNPKSSFIDDPLIINSCRQQLND